MICMTAISRRLILSWQMPNTLLVQLLLLTKTIPEPTRQENGYQLEVLKAQTIDKMAENQAKQIDLEFRRLEYQHSFDEKNFSRIQENVRITTDDRKHSRKFNFGKLIAVLVFLLLLVVGLLIVSIFAIKSGDNILATAIISSITSLVVGLLGGYGYGYHNGNKNANDNSTSEQFP